MCEHKISFVQHFTRTRLYLERHVYNMAKTCLEVFFCVLVSWLFFVNTA